MRPNASSPIRVINSFVRRRPDSLLHHYTNSAGLIGIFESKAIWATSVYHLNDSEEYLPANRLLRKEIARRREDGASSGNPISDWLKEFDDEEFKRKEHVFIASFSEKSDLLSQWRAYTSCDDAYSIGFSASELEHTISAFEGRLVKCVYKAEEQESLIGDLLDYIHKHRLRLERLKGPKSCGLMARVANTVVSVLAAMKNPSFEEEQEWRIVVELDSRQPMFFRSGRFGIVPYYKLPLTTDKNKKLIFSDVMIGPTTDREAAEFAVDQLIGDNAIPWKKPFDKLISHSLSSLRR